MKNIVGVSIKKPGKVHFFEQGFLQIDIGEKLIVEIDECLEYGEAVIVNRKVDEKNLKANLKRIIRIATKEDTEHLKKNKIKEKEALKICEEKIKKHKLEMKLTNVEYKFDNSKLLFYFTAEARIDFRELVKDLAVIFRTRIELRQIGVRDEVKRIGGNGVCGRELCCCSFLNDFENVSIKMAKEQNLSLNPTKISGNCGRLMCCLKYEQNVYEEKLKNIPKIGSIVKTEDGEGTVEGIETLKEKVKVKIKDGDGYLYKTYKVSDLIVLKSVQEDDTEISEELKKLED